MPVLRISGAQDPATPSAMAEQAARGLTHSRLISIAHGTHLTASPCIDNLLEQFIARGSASGLDASCVDQIRRPPFLTLQQVDEIRKRAR